ncbi:uncharacterized protein LOC127661277 [Xyrauchen texanus]|uniref:uncharacterized protein LOC127661277 n=1 Tax=Xyrauchen texanus TaxID=154827 RepID=UPI00224209BE|nr:uncharacterized protein LOC127661277 [Xyrauchen texanus]XP_052007873.1 uncharacterized protein LOC127661277 [Xyrauchen texanus]
MNITQAFESDFTDAEKQHAVLDSTDGDTEALDRQYVHVLLDISEEDDWMEQDKHEFQSQTGWEDAVEGWGRSPPLALFLQAQRKGKRIKQNIIDSHCILCAELNLPICCTAGSAPEPCYDISDENFRKTDPIPQDFVMEAHNTPSSASSDVIHSQLNISGPLINKLPSGDDQCAHNKSLSVCYCHKAPCLMLKEKGVGQVGLSFNNFSVLPPVKESRNLRSSSLFKRMEPIDWYPAEEGVIEAMTPGATGAVSDGERVGVNGENSYQGSPTSKHRLGQRSNDLPSTCNIILNKKYELPSRTVADTLPRSTYPLGANLRQDELAKPSPRNNTSYRLYSGHKVNSQRRPETQHLMLTGTRLPMPVSSQRIL